MLGNIWFWVGVPWASSALAGPLVMPLWMWWIKICWANQPWVYHAWFSVSSFERDRNNLKGCKKSPVIEARFWSRTFQMFWIYSSTAILWSSRVSSPSIPGCYVNKSAPHEALKASAWGRLTSDEMVVLHRAESRPDSGLRPFRFWQFSWEWHDDLIWDNKPKISSRKSPPTKTSTW